MIIRRSVTAEVEPPVRVALHIEINLFKSVGRCKFGISLDHLLIHPALYGGLNKVPNLVTLGNSVGNSAYAVNVLIHNHKLVHSQAVVNVRKTESVEGVIPAPYVAHAGFAHYDSIRYKITETGNCVGPHDVGTFLFVFIFAIENDIDELDFFTEALEYGFTLEDFKELGNYDYAKQFIDASLTGPMDVLQE